MKVDTYLLRAIGFDSEINELKDEQFLFQPSSKCDIEYKSCFTLTYNIPLKTLIIATEPVGDFKPFFVSVDIRDRPHFEAILKIYCHRSEIEDLDQKIKGIKLKETNAEIKKTKAYLKTLYKKVDELCRITKEE